MSVANCGHDENGKYSGGKAGDQSGTEWYVRQWYDFGQNVVLVHPDQKVNDLVADLAVEGAENDLVGYDQGERTTFYTALKAAGWRPSKITTACEADCSSGVAVIVQAAGHLLGDAKLQGVSKDCYTGNLRAALVAAGYRAYTESKYLTGESYLPRGAVNLNESKHVNVEVTGGSSASNPGTSALPDVAQVALKVIDGAYGNGDERKKKLEAEGYDYAAVQAEVNRLLNGGAPSVPALAPGKYQTVVNALNVRTGPGTSYAVKKKSQLTANAQANSNASGQLNVGTRMDVSEVRQISATEAWGLIPSGWVALVYNGKAFAKRVD